MCREPGLPTLLLPGFGVTLTCMDRKSGEARIHPKDREGRTVQGKAAWRFPSAGPVFCSQGRSQTAEGAVCAQAWPPAWRTCPNEGLLRGRVPSHGTVRAKEQGSSCPLDPLLTIKLFSHFSYNCCVRGFCQIRLT